MAFCFLIVDEVSSPSVLRFKRLAITNEFRWRVLINDAQDEAGRWYCNDAERRADFSVLRAKKIIAVNASTELFVVPTNMSAYQSSMTSCLY